MSAVCIIQITTILALKIGGPSVFFLCVSILLGSRPFKIQGLSPEIRVIWSPHLSGTGSAQAVTFASLNCRELPVFPPKTHSHVLSLVIFIQLI